MKILEYNGDKATIQLNGNEQIKLCLVPKITDPLLVIIMQTLGKLIDQRLYDKLLIDIMANCTVNIFFKYYY